MLESLFCPKSVAIIGVGREEGSVGHDIFDNIRAAGFSGKCFAINPKATEIHGEKVYPSIFDISDPVDLVVIAVPSQSVPSALEQSGSKGIKAAIIISAGFKETGIEGAKLEKELGVIAQKYNMRILGPNCLGAADTACKLNATFAKEMPFRGNIAMISQSGALLTAILDWAKAEHIGFSKFVSMGNKVDINEVDLLKALADDPSTKVICSYMEGITQGRAFMDEAASVSFKKPIIVIKSGVTDAGARAVSSHTGTLAGSQQAYNCAFKQSGIVHAHSIEDLFDYAVGFSYQPLPKTKNLAILTNAGGPGIMATDACEQHNVPLASFDRSTIDNLREALPQAAGLYNPVDVLGDAKADRYQAAMRYIMSDDDVGALLIILTPQATTDILGTARAISEVSKEFPDKPVYTCFMGKADVDAGINVLKSNQIPNYYYPERAVATYAAVLSYISYLEIPKRQLKEFKANKKTVQEIFQDTRAQGRRDLPDVQASQVADAYGIRIARTALVHDVGDAVEVAQYVGYPVALKIASPDILHKSDVGGIAVDLYDKDDVEEEYYRIMDNVERFMPDARIWGVSVQEMIKGARETIIGVNRDPQFGHMIMFGLGGIYIEVLKDVVFRIAPVTESEARSMISEINAYELLRGVRGQASSDIDSIVDTILRISQLVTDFPEIIEMDINPFMVLDKGRGGVAADVRITIGE